MIKVLLIEDHVELMENTAELLELEGFEVLTAKNGREGLDLANNKNPDIILCDIMMPRMSGHEVFTELKKNPSTSSIPFIFVTASAQKKDIQAGLDMGADEYLHKPFDNDFLIETINRCLERD